MGEGLYNPFNTFGVPGPEGSVVSNQSTKSDKGVRLVGVSRLVPLFCQPGALGLWPQEERRPKGLLCVPPRRRPSPRRKLRVRGSVTLVPAPEIRTQSYKKRRFAVDTRYPGP